MTQSIKAIVGNSRMSRSFADSATSGQFDGNLLLSDLSSQNLGLEMPNEVVNSMQVTYDAGCAVWRVIDSNTLRTERFGFASKEGYVCDNEAIIQPYKIKSTDLLQVYPKAVNSTSGDTEVLGWLISSRGAEPFGCTTAENATNTAMSSLITGLSLGDWGFGTTLKKICLQAEDGATLFSITIKDQTGGTVYQSKGNVRAPSAGSKSVYYNLEVDLNIGIQKGWILYASVTS